MTIEAEVGMTGYENGRKIHEPQNANVASRRWKKAWKETFLGLLDITKLC